MITRELASVAKAARASVGTLGPTALSVAQERIANVKKIGRITRKELGRILRSVVWLDGPQAGAGYVAVGEGRKSTALLVIGTAKNAGSVGTDGWRRDLRTRFRACDPQ